MAVGTATVLLAFTICRAKRHIDPIHPVAGDLREIWLALEGYRADHDGAWPGSLADLYPECLRDKESLSCPTIPSVPGIKPRTSYGYVPCRNDAPADTIIVYANVRGRRDEEVPAHLPLFVLRFNGAVGFLKPDEFENAIRALGEDYDSLPEME